MDNKLLAKVPADELKRLQPHLHEVRLEYMQVLSEPDESITQVYFPTRGVLSMVNEPDSGDIVEFATIGNEGIVGVPVLLGSDSMPSRVMVQVAGSGFQIESRRFSEILKQTPAFNARLMRYVMALLNQVAQATSCNRLHEVQERCARWLLHTGRFGSGGMLLLSHHNRSLRELAGDLNCSTEIAGSPKPLRCHQGNRKGGARSPTELPYIRGRRSRRSRSPIRLGRLQTRRVDPRIRLAFQRCQFPVGLDR
jgi:CRP-like cAMP-binding protein